MRAKEYRAERERVQEGAARAVPLLIPDDAVYSLEAARVALGFRSRKTLSAEISAGRLRASLRAGRRWIKGADLRAWLVGGEA